MYRLIRPLLFALPAERAHELALLAGRLCQGAGLLPLLRAVFAVEHPALHTRFLGLHAANPLGLAAGMDKNARLVPFWAALGLGHVEVGSVSAEFSAGNPRPRAFRLPRDRALINRLGLPNLGADAVAALLQRRHPQPPDLPRRPLLGVNLAKTHRLGKDAVLGAAGVADFCRSFRRLAPLADYVTLNISCPNTAEGKTFEEPAALAELLSAIFATRRQIASTMPVPVLLKLSPLPALPSGELATGGLLSDLLAVARAHGIAGLVIANTTADRHGLRTSPQRLSRIGKGGLSGPPLTERATELVRGVFRHTGGALPIIGVGGVDSADAAYRMIRAGATLVQLYTGLVYQGPGLPARIHRGLLDLLERDGLSSISEAIGSDA